MTLDALFKAMFMVAFVVAAASATAAAKRAARVHGAPINQLAHEVKGLVFVRALLGLFFYAALAGWMFNLEWFRWARVSMPTEWRVLGTVILVAMVALQVIGFRALGSNYRGGVGLYPAHALVTAGPYRWVRHPIYVSFIVIMLAATLVSSNWLLGLSGGLLVISIAAVRVPIEERELRARFGVVWDEYQRRVGAFLPKLSR